MKSNEAPLTAEARHAAGRVQMISYFENQYIGWHYVAIKSIKKIIVNINDFYSDFDYDKSNAEQDLFSPDMVNREIYNGWLYEALSHAEQAIEDLFSLMKCAQSPDWFARDVVVYKAAAINKYIRMFRCDSPEYYLEQLHIPNVEDNDWTNEMAHAKYKESVEVIRKYISDLVEFYNYYYLDYCQYKHGLSIMLRAGGKNDETPLKSFIKTYDSWNFVGRHINEKNTPALAIDLFPETAPYLNKLNKENNMLHYTLHEVDIERFINITEKAYMLLYVLRRNLMFECENEKIDNGMTYALPSGKKETFYTMTIIKRV